MKAWRHVLTGLLITIIFVSWAGPTAGADFTDRLKKEDRRGDARGGSDGETAWVRGEALGSGGRGGSSGGGGSGGPNCTMSDGTSAYLSYEGLKYTSMEEQRTDIRPEEQRPGVYLHSYCGGEHLDFKFYPDEEPIDPTTLAETVSVRPPAPRILTNPATGSHLVNLDAWFWTDTFASLSESATVGPVSVTVSAAPRSIVIDPGDGSGSFTCEKGGTAYQPSRPAGAQSSDCTHTYGRAGTFTARMKVIYDVSFTSNIGVDGDLGTIEPDASTTLTVRESQAVNTG